MSLLSEQFYRKWRARNLDAFQFLEIAGVQAPPESLLQAVWRHQRLRRNQLTILDGRSLQILHPGFLNREAGPDFRDAILVFGDEPAIQGDVEIDLASSNWRSHRHHENPAYRNVLLHVVWEAGSRKEPLPALELKTCLDAPLEELTEWLGTESARAEPPSALGKCQESLAKLDLPLFRSLLRQASHVRMCAKASALEARARQVGLDNALWEALFGALGYKHNYWPMRQVAEKIPEMSAWQNTSLVGWQARLLGLSGFLPSEPPPETDEAARYVTRLWDHWWRERKSDDILPSKIWRLHGIRPNNHPQRRLALGAHWLAHGGLLERLEAWMLADIEDSQLSQTLLSIFQPVQDDFWSWHWAYPSERTDTSIPLLGAARLADIAANVLLPWFWTRAKSSGNALLQQSVVHRYENWPKSEDNIEIRKLCSRMLGGRKDLRLRLAMEQQGLLQLAQDFCRQSNALCEDCRLVQMAQNILSNPSESF